MIYTNNQGDKSWAMNIKNYFDKYLIKMNSDIKDLFFSKNNLDFTFEQVRKNVQNNNTLGIFVTILSEFIFLYDISSLVTIFLQKKTDGVTVQD